MASATSSSVASSFFASCCCCVAGESGGEEDDLLLARDMRLQPCVLKPFSGRASSTEGTFKSLACVIAKFKRYQNEELGMDRFLTWKQKTYNG